MAKLVSILPGYYRIALPNALSDSMHGRMAAFELNTVRIFDADVAEGVGYTFTCGRNGSAIHSLLERDFADFALTEDADRVEFLWNKLWWGLHYGGRGGPTVLALSAFDMALWDLKAKKLNQPLWKLLGGNDPCVQCYAGGIDLELPLDRLLQQTNDNLAKGFRAIKMKVGRKRLAEDVERIKAMRRHLGEDFPLMVDANMKWTVDQAIRAARAFQPFDPVWLEEPIIPDDFSGHSRLVRDGGLPIATGENLRTLWDFRHLIEVGGVSFPEPDVTNCGGITPFMKIAHLAEAFNLPLTTHGAHDVTVHLLAAVPNASYLEAHGFGLNDYIAEPLRIKDGCAIAPDRSGHGIEFDWKRLDAIRA
ncbi:MAG: mandelate racemase/muconate lactonizing enzyme family protein [Verrucomicrobia bacterium]|nr:mandelate racemase/muconate lactonizing enzyme family protein [Verrucomicrobiota bacterium]MBV8377012.1 mandelate racemase/muconate lactonizing enzyme family protein [Verrucomicrobiota bacterium]